MMPLATLGALLLSASLTIAAPAASATVLPDAGGDPSPTRTPVGDGGGEGDEPEKSKLTELIEADAEVRAEFAARGVVPDPTREKRAALAEDVLRAGLRSQINSAQDVAEEALQLLGQVVVEKAMESGWSLLSDHLEELANCGSTDADKLVATCAALKAVDIHDLVASSDMLIVAAFNDLFALDGEAGVGELFTVFRGLSWKSIAAAWRVDGAASVRAQFNALFAEHLVRIYADTPLCAELTTPAERTAWALGKCISYGTVKCEVAATLTECFPGWAELPPDSLAVVSSWRQGEAAKLGAKDMVNLVFEIEEIGAIPAKRERLNVLQDLLVGLLDVDPNRAFSAAGNLFFTLASAANGGDTDECPVRRASGGWERSACGREFFKLLVAIAQISATEDVEERKEAVKGLIARMTRRSKRRSGAVASLGGSFGLVGGARLANEPGAGLQRTLATPLHLGLGFGLDTYHAGGRAGFHGEVSAFDLGQYVALSDGALTVAKPDLKAAVAPSIKLGVHFALKETPLFFALFGGASPFVRSEAEVDGDSGEVVGGDRMTWTAGLTLGIYVPFIDFN